MKRNRLPDDNEERQTEAKLIGDRLDEFFAHCHPEQRQIARCNRANWIPGKRHARIEQNIRITPRDIVKYCPQLGYHYLGPYETLYCLDTNQLLIFHNSLPLNLAEAYKLIIENEVQFREYKVLQQLTRTGYICLRPTVILTENDSEETTSQQKTITSPEPIEVFEGEEELFSIDSIKLPYKDVLGRLQELGPRTQREPAKRPTNGKSDIAFDVYRRESFAKKKAQLGEADHYVIICDLANRAPPDAEELLNLSNNYPSNISGDGKLLFALVDDDSSIFFAQYNQLNSLSPTGTHQAPA